MEGGSSHADAARPGDIAGSSTPSQLNRRAVQSFDTLLTDLATRCEVTCRLRADATAAPIRQWTPPTPLQAQALALLRRVQYREP